MIQRLIMTINEVLYDVLLWILLIPKTLYKIVVSPSWIDSYVASQLSLSVDDQFDSYAAPALFFVVLGALPAVLLFPALRAIDPDSPTLKAFSELGFEAKILCLAVFLASWPLAASVVLQLLDRREISRQSLRPVFFSQAYCFGALYFFVYLSIPGFLVIVEIIPKGWWNVPLMLPLLYFYWFLYTEVRVIRTQLRISVIKSLLVLVLMYFAGLVLMVVTEVLLLAGVVFMTLGDPGGCGP